MKRVKVASLAIVLFLVFAISTFWRRRKNLTAETPMRVVIPRPLTEGSITGCINNLMERSSKTMRKCGMIFMRPDCR